MSPERESLLPLFRPSSLDNIPIYSLVLQYHDLLELKVDMKYDQLRSPQVNALLIKPLVSELNADLSEGSLYGLMACMVQFQKEASLNVAMAGVSTTRAMICEIIATKLLKEYDSDGLINALTYDFYPLANGTTITPQGFIPRWQRISTIELAITCEAKKFLAHPVVTQVMESIWNGSIMFQSSLHKLHRVKFANEDEVLAIGFGRRGPGVTYDYSDASVLKLSRLRVPRYRNILNMLSFCVMLLLYIKVLAEQQKSITASEAIFGLWALGFILDEMVAFTDVGFQLYVMSLWNLLDVVILCLLVTYAIVRCLALRAHELDSSNAIRLYRLSKDILASIAVFLFPRLFSILDNYESFSRMVVAVRRMSIDLLAAWVVIIVFSSGFWVAFTMAFARDVFSANEVAFDLLKILFGFTPAVWQNWEFYSRIGQCMLLFYLFITHFVILTILIAVLSDSFTRINMNSKEEHRFLFAVNTISMIKAESSSLFSYTSPLNLIEWVVRPLIYVLPLRQFLVMNRTIIKLTHFPALVSIFLYERLHWKLQQRELAKLAEAETRRQEALDNAGLRRRAHPIYPLSSSPKRSGNKRRGLNKSGIRDRVSNMDLLDEVFKRPYKGTVKIKKNNNRDVGVSTGLPQGGVLDRIVSGAPYGSLEGDKMSDVMASDLEYGRRVFESDYDDENSDNDGASFMTRDTDRKVGKNSRPRTVITHRDSITSSIKPSATLFVPYNRRSLRRRRELSNMSVLTPVPSSAAIASQNEIGDENPDLGVTDAGDDEDDGEEAETTIQDLFRAYQKRQNRREDESVNDPYESTNMPNFEYESEETQPQMHQMLINLSKQLEELNAKLASSSSA